MSAIVPDLKSNPEGNALALRRAQRLQAIHFAKLRQVFGDTVPVIDLGVGGATLDPLAGRE